MIEAGPGPKVGMGLPIDVTQMCAMYICAYICMCIYLRMHIYIYRYLYMYAYASMYVTWGNVHGMLHVYTDMSVYTYAYIYTTSFGTGLRGSEDRARSMCVSVLGRSCGKEPRLHGFSQASLREAGDLISSQKYGSKWSLTQL